MAKRKKISKETIEKAMASALREAFATAQIRFVDLTTEGTHQGAGKAVEIVERPHATAEGEQAKPKVDPSKKEGAFLTAGQVMRVLKIDRGALALLVEEAVDKWEDMTGNRMKIDQKRITPAQVCFLCGARAGYIVRDEEVFKAENWDGEDD